MAEDKNTIGLTDANRAIMDEFVEKCGFETGMDAAKFAFALAVNRGSEFTPVEKAGTIWNVGSFDEAGDLKTLVKNLFPETDTPYRVIESLVNAGFAALGSEMEEKPGLRIEEIIKRETQAASS